MRNDYIPSKAFSRAVRGYQKQRQRAARVFCQFAENDPVQMDATDLEDTLEEALLANEERGLRHISVPVPEDLNTAFIHGHVEATGQEIFSEFVYRVYHTLGIPRHYIEHDAETKNLNIKIF